MNGIRDRKLSCQSSSSAFCLSVSPVSPVRSFVQYTRSFVWTPSRAVRWHLRSVGRLSARECHRFHLPFFLPFFCSLLATISLVPATFFLGFRWIFVFFSLPSVHSFSFHFISQQPSIHSTSSPIHIALLHFDVTERPFVIARSKVRSKKHSENAENCCTFGVGASKSPLRTLTHSCRRFFRRNVRRRPLAHGLLSKTHGF